MVSSQSNGNVLEKGSQQLDYNECIYLSGTNELIMNRGGGRIMGFNEEMKKVLLAGIGAVATTVEKSQEMVDTLIKKGEITVEQGKVLNEELKRNVQDSIASSAEKAEKKVKIEEVLAQMGKLDEEDLVAIKTKLAEMEK